jgi:hypothetical protein
MKDDTPTNLVAKGAGNPPDLKMVVDAPSIGSQLKKIAELNTQP